MSAAPSNRPATEAPSASAPRRRFEFMRDSFAFANELLWEYRHDAQTGRPTTVVRDPKPEYTLRCFVLTAATRKFFQHATFDGAQPQLKETEYRSLIRQVLARSPRCVSNFHEPQGRARHSVRAAEGQLCAVPRSRRTEDSALYPQRVLGPDERILIPGFDGLRAFSAAHERLLKDECGGAWRSYVLRSHWRMVFPISRRNQAVTAARLQETIARDGTAVVHLVLFPQLTINHGVVLFGSRKVPEGVAFDVYDPNDPRQPVTLAYHAATRTFHFPPNSYWAGGKLDVIEIYRNWFI